MELNLRAKVLLVEWIITLGKEPEAAAARLPVRSRQGKAIQHHGNPDRVKSRRQVTAVRVTSNLGGSADRCTSNRYIASASPQFKTRRYIPTPRHSSASPQFGTARFSAHHVSNGQTTTQQLHGIPWRPMQDHITPFLGTTLQTVSPNEHGHATSHQSTPRAAPQSGSSQCKSIARRQFIAIQFSIRNGPIHVTSW